MAEKGHLPPTPWSDFPDPVFRVAPDSSVVGLNGPPDWPCPRAAPPTRCLNDLLPPSVQLEGASVLSRARRTGQVMAFCFAHGARNREARFSPTADGVLLFMRDVTGLLAGEELVREQLAQSQKLLRQAPVGIFRTDLLGACTFVNERWKQLTHLSAHQALGNRWADAIHIDDRAMLFRAWEEAAESETKVTAQIRFTTAAGQRHMLTSASPIFSDEELTGYLGVMVDITERVEAQKETEATQAMMRRVTDTMPLLLFTTDLKTGQVGYVNQELERILGYPSTKLLAHGDGFWRSLHHDDHQEISEGTQQRLGTLKDGQVITRDVMLRHASGQWRWLRKHATVFTRDTEGHVVQVLTTAEDITAQKQAGEKLAAAHCEVQLKADELQRKNRSVEVLHEMSELLQSCNDRDEALAAIHDAMGQLFDRSGAVYLHDEASRGHTPEVVWGPDAGLHTRIASEDCWALRRGRPHSSSGGRSRLRCRHVEHEDGYLCVPLNAGGETLGMVYVEVSDIDEHARRLVRTVADAIALGLCNLDLRTTLREQALREPLTGLFNRRHMKASLEREIHQAQRRQSRVSVVMLDVDHFKRFNDTHGHEAGDLCLKTLAKQLQASVRRSDIACRFGGEEFALILPDCDLDGARERAETVRAHIASLSLAYRGTEIGPITVSMGVATWPLHGVDGDTLVRSADLALYDAKRGGRNRVAAAPSPTTADVGDEPAANDVAAATG